MHAIRILSLAGASVVGLGLVCASTATAGPFVRQTSIVASDPATTAIAHNPNLINAWGIARSATSPFWISAADTGLSPIYRGNGTLVNTITVTPAPGNTTGSPTGIVNNPTSGFQLTPGNNARFLFATEDGTISGWNPLVNATASVIMVDNSAGGANYKGLTLGTSSSGTFLYAANFGQGRIDVYDSSFAAVSLPGSFTDPTLPAGYSPFNVQALGGRLFVTYAPESGGDEVTGAGNGIVDEYDLAGNLVARVASNGVLNAPWGLDFAPATWDAFAGALLVGNFGDGRINMFDPATYAFLGTLMDVRDRRPLEIDGLWALMNGSGSSLTSADFVYFSAGPDDEAQGLFGSLAIVPEPATLFLFAGGGGILLRRRKRR